MIHNEYMKRAQMICTDEEYKEIKKEADKRKRSVSNFMMMIYENWKMWKEEKD